MCPDRSFARDTVLLVDAGSRGYCEISGSLGGQSLNGFTSPLSQTPACFLQSQEQTVFPSDRRPPEGPPSMEDHLTCPMFHLRVWVSNVWSYRQTWDRIMSLFWIMLSLPELTGRAGVKGKK